MGRFGALNVVVCLSTAIVPVASRALTLTTSCNMYKGEPTHTIGIAGLSELKDGSGNLDYGYEITGLTRIWWKDGLYAAAVYGGAYGQAAIFHSATASTEDSCYVGDIKADTSVNLEVQANCDNPSIECYVTVEQPPASPILIDLENDGFHLVGTEDAVDFDIDADGAKDLISWTADGTKDAFLALDRSGNGVIDNGAELFGNATRLADGSRAPNGYEALREFDKPQLGGNGDFVIDASDAVFASLVLWTDTNHNGFSESRELSSLRGENLRSIGLSYYESRLRDDFGNLFVFNSTASMGGVRHLVRIWTTDVYFVRVEN